MTDRDDNQSNPDLGKDQDSGMSGSSGDQSSTSGSGSDRSSSDRSQSDVSGDELGGSGEGGLSGSSSGSQSDGSSRSSSSSSSSDSSDISALHCAIAVRSNLTSIHGPTARTKLTPFSERSLRAAVTRSDNPCGAAAAAQTVVGGRARGRLVGGNLALLMALHGTPFQPTYDGAILVLEDVNEAPYRVERMLLQLRLSGALQRCAGIAFGSFTNTAETDDKTLGGDRSMNDVLREAAERVGVPTVCGIPMGHIADQWSLPLGEEAELDADEKRLTVLAA